MTYKQMVLRIDADLHKRFKLHCVQNDLSIQKMMLKLIVQFCTDEENKRGCQQSQDQV